MFEREYRVREDHPRARPLHHVFDPLPHIRLVAMDLAERTELFVDLERALFKAEERVFGERSALLAQRFPFRAVIAVAIHSDHHGDEFSFLLPRFELFRRLHCSPLFAEANLYADFSFANANSVA